MSSKARDASCSAAAASARCALGAAAAGSRAYALRDLPAAAVRSSPVVGGGASASVSAAAPRAARGKCSNKPYRVSAGAGAATVAAAAAVAVDGVAAALIAALCR